MELSGHYKMRFANLGGYTLIELLALIFIFTVATAAYQTVAKSHGMGMGIAAASISGALGFGIVVLFYRWVWRNRAARLAKLRTDYLGLYRVLTVPGGDQPTIMLEGAEIQAGDYGWESAPLLRDGLVYLHGLTPDWRVVWHAGFRPDQIDRIGLKPGSQYDYWVPEWVKPSPVICPYPIQPRETPSMGRPHHAMNGWRSRAWPQPRSGRMVRVKRTP